LETIQSIPNAARTFEALRHLGYDLNASIADIIDNSITTRVKSKEVNLFFNLGDDGNINCRIQDDGLGMKEKELEEAMRLGAEIKYDDADLGKFGMGLKTASLSHCNKLTVITKRKNSSTFGMQWDMDYVEKSKGWNLLKLKPEDVWAILDEESMDIGLSGTIVLWDNMEQLTSDYKSYERETTANNYYHRILKKLGVHISMVFHRFMDGTVAKSDRKTIKLNGRKLKAWDPFCYKEENSYQVKIKQELAELKIPGYNKPVLINGFILPTKDDFSSEKKWEAAKGNLSWNDSQGYYIYRANRLIRFGGWQGTRSKDEHTKLARMSIDIDPSLDKLFKITVNKNKIQFPEILYYHLKEKVNRVVIKEADKKYRKKRKSEPVTNKFRTGRTNKKVETISKNLVDNSNIKTSVNKKNEVIVENPAGNWIPNQVSEFLKYGNEENFEVISDAFDPKHFWKIICNEDEKFKVLVNTNHPFYTQIYKSNQKSNVSSAIDALLFALAFSELYNRNIQNSHLFDTFKTVCSKVLSKLSDENTF